MVGVCTQQQRQATCNMLFASCNYWSDKAQHHFISKSDLDHAVFLAVEHTLQAHSSPEPCAGSGLRDGHRTWRNPKSGNRHDGQPHGTQGDIATAQHHIAHRPPSAAAAATYGGIANGTSVQGQRFSFSSARP